jgi:hypothetical protein
MPTDYLAFVSKYFDYYRQLGTKAIAQIPDTHLHWQYNAESNSIATIVQHLHGNMLSRWTDLLTTDGEKEWRDRDSEFIVADLSRDALILLWNQGWDCMMTSLQALTIDDLDTIIYIRHEPHTVHDAITRQLAHYPYHIGQIVYIAKMINNAQWHTLSIARGASQSYNMTKLNESQHKKK